MGAYKELGVLAAARVSRMTGLEVHVIDNEMAMSSGHHDPVIVKLSLPQYVAPGQSFLYFDSDIVMLQPWDPRVYEDDPLIVAVRDQYIDHYDLDLDIPRPVYFNCGMFIAHPEHHWHIFELARQLWLAEGDRLAMADQTALNRAALWLNSPVRLIDERYNFLRYHLRGGDRASVVMAHYTPYGRELAHAHLRRLNEQWQSGNDLKATGCA
jgi:lipopolysaccharide biosynthesis glycosyltransferase